MKPGDFYVGVISFFAILVPGAVATAVLEPLVGARVFGPIIAAPIDGTAKWIVFLIAAYFIGHLSFLLGACLDPVYDRVRRRFDPYDNENAYQCARRIRDKMLGSEEKDAANPFQWSRAILTFLYPSAIGDVHSLEADSKFFRTLMVVLALSGIAFLWQGKYPECGFALVLVVGCFFRYYDQRLKSTTRAYIYLMALDRLGKLEKAPLEKAPNESTPAKA